MAVSRAEAPTSVSAAGSGYNAFRLVAGCPDAGRSKRQALLDAGAAHVIVTDEQDLVKEALRMTGGKGARVVFDPVGGPTFAKLAQATARLGILFL